MSVRGDERTGYDTALVEIRPYRPEDEAGVVTVWNTAMWADPVTMAAWRSVYLCDRNFRPGLCPVAVVDGSIVGFVLAFEAFDGELSRPRSGESCVVAFGVLPEFRRSGIATKLFRVLEEGLLENGVGRIVVGPYIPSYIAPGVDVEAYPEAVHLLGDWGAATASWPLSMKVSLTGYRARVPVRQAARTMIVRAAVPRDIVPCLEFVRREFPHWIADAASVTSQIFGADPRPVSLFVALDNDEITGFALSRGERFGPFGVHERARGQGIGSMLLAATLTTMRAKGFHCAWFLWTNDRAARLYRSHGFEEVRRFALMAKEVSS